MVKEAIKARSIAGVSSMHDPTKGGLATTLWELARAADVGLMVEEEKVPFIPECLEICGALGLDPLGLLALGALLITLPAEQAPRLLVALEEDSIKATEIGRVTAPGEGLQMRTRAGRMVPVPRFERDELARFLSP